MLTLTNFSLGYRGKPLFDHISLSIQPGSITGLVAPNGHGKTTLLKAIAGCGGGRASGSLAVDGINPQDGVSLRRAIFYVPGDATLLYPGLTAQDHLKMTQRLWMSALDIETVAEKTGVTAFARKRVRTLSQGMKQQLTLAIAYLTEAPYLLLDEPMNALDPTNVQINSDILRALVHKGTAIVMSSHILDNVDALADRIVFIKDQKLLEHDPAASRESALDIYRRLYRQ